MSLAKAYLTSCTSFVSFIFSVERRYMDFCFGFIVQNDLPSFSAVSKSFVALNVMCSTFNEEVMFIFHLLSVAKATIHRTHQRSEIHPSEREPLCLEFINQRPETLLSQNKTCQME